MIADILILLLKCQNVKKIKYVRNLKKKKKKKKNTGSIAIGNQKLRPVR